MSESEAPRERTDPEKSVGPSTAPPRGDAHSFLDPALAENQPALYRSLFRDLQSIRDDDGAYTALLNRILYPPGVERPLDPSRIEIAYYLNEAARYIEALLDLFPRRRRALYRPLQRVRDCNDLRELLGMVFDPSARRRGFEAQRKIYLCKLFFDVEHTWEVQRGEVHRQFLRDLLQRRLLHRTVEERDVDIAFNIAADGVAIDYEIGRSLPEQEAWRFRLRELDLSAGRRQVRIHVYFYSCRSKREVLPYRYLRGQKLHELHTVEKWTKLSLRRDASIISKMLRTGIADPGAIPDIVGIMFIVEDVTEVNYLRDALFELLGGPLRIRNLVDTLTREDDQPLLNPFSGAGYRVFKAEMDVLYPDGGEETRAYNFAVEMQLYTLESYLRTIHTRHYASHQQLKRRQFIDGLAPLLFPESIYGRSPGPPERSE